MEEAIVAENLTKQYRNGTLANKDLNLKVHRGEILAILGPNGAGKTTLVKQISGELKPTSGRIHVGGFDVIAEPQSVKKLIGVTAQLYGLHGHLTVKEHIFYFARLKGLDSVQAEKNSVKIIRQLDLQDIKDQKIWYISGGQKKRVILSVSMVNEPEILILDEPTSGLDPIGKRKCWDLVKSLRSRETTVLLTTQDMNEAEELSDRVAILRKGEILAIDTPHSLKSLIKDERRVRITLKSDASRLFDELKKAGLTFSANGSKDSECTSVVVSCAQSEVIDVIKMIGLDIITDILITEPTLEDVFIKLAR